MLSKFVVRKSRFIGTDWSINVAFKVYDQDTFVYTSLHGSTVVLGLFDYFSIVILPFNLQLRFFFSHIELFSDLTLI